MSNRAMTTMNRAQLMHEVKELRERIAELSEPRLREMSIKRGVIEMTIEEATGIVHRMAAAMCQMLDEHKAKNYLQEEVSLGTNEFVLLVQRRNGKTPHQLRQEAEDGLASAVAAERATWEAKLDAETVPRWQCDALVAVEREACAKVVEVAGGGGHGAFALADIIRARGVK